MELSRGIRLIAPYVAAVLVVAMVIVAGARRLRVRIADSLSVVSDGGTAPDGLARLCVFFGLAVLSFLAGIELLASAGFAVGQSLGPWVVACAALLAGFLTYLGARALVPQRARLACVVTLAIVSVLMTLLLPLAGHFDDISWDGNAYHQEGVVAIAQGWNPVLEPDAQTNIWVAHYAKGAWVRDAALYTATGSLEESKAVNLLLMITVFVVWLGLMSSLAPTRLLLGGTIAALVALNPVSLVQSFAFMVDGQLASLMSIAIALGCLLFTKLGRWPVVLSLAATVTMLVTVKFTGAVYVAVLLGGLAAAMLARRTILSRTGILATLIAAMVIAALFVGANPYVTNTLSHGSPFYPLAGRGARDVVTEVTPGNFVGRGRLAKLELSLFSATTNVQGPGTTAHLKVPFTVSTAELWPYLWSDQRTGGFGPLFGGVLLLSVAGIALLVSNRGARSSPLVLAGLGLWGLLVISALTNSEAWFARFAPQLWLAPALVAALLVLASASRAGRSLGWLLCGILLVNAMLVGAVNFSNEVLATRRINAVLASVAKWPGPVSLQEREFEAEWVRFAEHGIPFRLVSAEDHPAGGVAIPYSPAMVYPREKL